MISISRRLQFCAGHRVYGHESKCRNMHGHNYVVFIHAEPEGAGGLDSLGRVIDFSVLKERVGGWIDTNWDHGFIYWEDDGEVDRTLGGVAGQKVFRMKNNPTAENMAEYLLKAVCPAVLENTGVVVKKVVLWETENCCAEVTIS